jgi:hypothetical protein
MEQRDVVRVGSEFDRQIVHIHGAGIPLQLEALLLLLHAIFRQSIGPEIIPLLTHPVAAFRHRSSLPPTSAFLADYVKLAKKL